MDDELVRLLEQHRTEMLAEMRQVVRESVEEARVDLGARIAHARADLGTQVERTRLDLGTLVEGLRDEVHAISGGHVGLDRQLQELRKENEAAHREILATVNLSHRDLDRRVTRLDSKRKRT